jgi:nucleoside phosphorylase
MRRALIFTAKPTETKAVKEQLLGPIGSQRTARTYAYNVFHLKAAINKNQPVKNLDIALYETGRGQEEVMPAIAPIVQDFLPDIVLYIGCAGGDRKELKVNDVFIPTQVWPYEKGKETTRGFQRRAHPLQPNRYLVDLATSIADRPKWKKRLPAGYKLASKVATGGLASGSKVLANEEGKIWKNAKAHNDEIVAVETEAHGFFKAMEPLHLPYLMIRGISDLLTNKNEKGKTVDDNRQMKATANAASLAAQLILEADYQTLRKSRGAGASPLASKLAGFWRCQWDYGPEKCEDLISIENVDPLGLISGRRISQMSGYTYVFDVVGTLYGSRLHLTAIPSDYASSISVGLVLQAIGNFGDTLMGFAIRPLGNPPFPELGSNVLRYGENLWASLVEDKRLGNPESEARSLWKAYEQHQ